MKVQYTGACLDASGYAEAARNHIAALDHVGVNVSVQPITFERFRSDLGKLGLLTQKLINKHSSGNIQILHMTPEIYRQHIKKDKYTIGYSAWETSRLPKNWVPMINQLDEVWVPSSHNKLCFEESGIKIPVHVMPHPLSIEEKQELSDSVIANTDNEDFVFYSIFQWTERKNAIDLLKAYLTEFKPNEKVALVLKTYITNPENPGETNRLKEVIREIKKKLYLDNYPKILLVSSLLSKSQINALHDQGDCYVSLNRCEGFGLPIAEAMLASNPVITTGYGGPQDFAETQYLIDYNLTPVYGMPWKHYTGEMLWAQPDILDARKKMRLLYDNQDKAKKVGKLGRKEIEDTLSWKKIGNKMKQRLEEIERKL